MRPKVSIVVPCWGVEKYLDQCVESLVNQTLQDIEIILVDDVSPDRVPQMCDEWAKKDARIKVVHKPKNEGLGMACNTGIENATGKYISFCDSDDWVDAEMYETMYNEAECNSSDVVYTGLRRVDIVGKPLGILPHVKKHKILKSRPDINTLARDMIASAPDKKNDNQIQVSAKVVLYRRNLIDANHLRFVSEREVPSEDLHFNLHILSKAEIVSVLPNVFYNYRCNTNSITTKNRAFKRGRFNNSLKRYNYTLAECKELGLGADGEIRCNRMLLGSARLLICSLIKGPGKKDEIKKEVSDICCNSIMKDVLKKYPIYRMPLLHRLFAYGIKYNCYALLYLMARMK